MKLKSFGCSFIYGTDLVDDGRGRLIATPSQLTWPSLFAKDLNYTYECYARPGSGNLRILEKLLNQVDHSNIEDLFVVGWSWIDRFDYTTTPIGPIMRTEYIDNEVWKTVMPIDNNSCATNYYRDLHSQYRDKLTSLIYIKTGIDALKQKNIPFIMTYMDNILFETQWQYNDAIKTLQDYVCPYMTTFENQTFLEWSKKKGFLISETLHPLEQAHQAAFELIKSYNLV
jgi:hypothetical protein